MNFARSNKVPFFVTAVKLVVGRGMRTKGGGTHRAERNVVKRMALEGLCG